LPVTFDLDNTILCGDIGEAILAILVRRGLLDAARVSAVLGPPFRLPDGRVVRVRTGPDLAEYYEAYLAPTVHGAADRYPLGNAYAWAVEVMEGLRASDVVAATSEAMAHSQPGSLPMLEVAPGREGFPAPYFYPEMVELIAELMRHGFEIWVVSASNVWSVRHLIQEHLNPRLRQAGVRDGIAADHVVGAAVLLTNRRRELFKDSVLVRESSAYARADRSFLSQFRLTRRLQFPVPVYSGKVGLIWDALGRRPFLAAGDSPGDHAMLTFAEHRVWIARLEKSGLQTQTVQLMRRTEPTRWVVQPTLSGRCPGFVSARSALASRGGSLTSAVRESLGRLADFLAD
jgi:phosphoserine phosphatase